MFLRTLTVTAGPMLARPIARALNDAEALITRTNDLEPALELLERKPFDLVVLEEGSPPRHYPADLEALRQRFAGVEVLILAGSPDAESHSAWLAAGAYSVVYSDSGEKAMVNAISTVASRRREAALSAHQKIPGEDYRLGDYVTRSPVMRHFLRSARRIAQRDTTILLLGETGVGKGLLARALHNEGPRAGEAFVAVNCGAIAPTLLESEIFGHERGAFTGADRARRGRFELAHKGTIFLDEIGDLSLSLQVKLLRVLEERIVQPLGSEKSLAVDVRIIAATNRDLEAEVAAKRFRSDLFYRLNVVTLKLPPLRDRVEDIPEIVTSYVEHHRVAMAVDVEGVDATGLAALEKYPWPGNLRELANVIERAVIMSTREQIGLDALPVGIQEFADAVIHIPKVAEIEKPPARWLDQSWAEVRREAIEEAEIRYLRGLLEATKGKVGSVASRAGMDPRSLYEKMKKYGLRKEDFR